jgi:hypothetical protein
MKKMYIFISRGDIEIFTSSTIAEEGNSRVLLKHVPSVPVKRTLIKSITFFSEFKNVRKPVLTNGGFVIMWAAVYQ